MIMHFDQILVIADTRRGETRVALTPQAVSTLVKKGYRPTDLSIRNDRILDHKF